MRRLGFDMPEVKKSDRTFEEFAKDYIAKHSLGRPKTRRSHQTCLNALLNSDMFKGKRLTEISTEAVAKYHAERGTERRVSANRELGFLKMILQRAVEWGELGSNPAARVKKFAEQRNRLRILSDDEAARLLDAARPHLRPLLMLLLTTGMRPNEAFALRWAYDGWDTEKKAKSSIVSIKKRVIFIPASLSKNHKDREVPLSNELVALLDALPRDASGKVFEMNSAPKSFRAAVDDAELKNVTLYTLKHTAASRMIRAGVDIVTVCELLGHADIKTTMIYCHSSAETKRDAVARVSRIYARCSKTKSIIDEAPEKPVPPSMYN
jgi:integrase